MSRILFLAKTNLTFGIASLFFLGAQAFAALPPMGPRVLTAPTAVIGGVSGSGFSLLGIKKEIASKTNTERVIIDIGDVMGRPKVGMPAYYHAQFTKDPSRLVIDFAQMRLSKMSELQLQNTLKDSKHVRHSRLLKDPSDGSMSLILDLRPTTKIRVMQVAGVKGTSKVVVDLL